MLKLVIAFPFSIYPLNHGGALRGYHLLKQLTRHFKVTAIVTDFAEKIEENILRDLGNQNNSLHVLQVNVGQRSSGMRSKMLDRLRTLKLSGSLTTSSNSIVLAVAQQLKRLAQLSSVDVVVLTAQELAICGKIFESNTAPTIRIVDMHNVDHWLAKQELESQGLLPEANASYRRLLRSESRLHRFADGLLACSEDDLSKLLEINESTSLKGAVVPNGVDSASLRFHLRNDEKPPINVLFCGSLNYRPNLDGLNWFHSSIWPQIRDRVPGVRLVVVGKGFESAKLRDLIQDESVEVVGEVPTVIPYYRSCGVSICPLRMGSGTRLKILEAMALGNPVVTTSVGCEGLNVQNDRDLLIRDTTHGFASAVCDLIQQPDRYRETSLNARRMVEKRYDWAVIGDLVASVIAQWAQISHSVGRAALNNSANG